MAVDLTSLVDHYVERLGIQYRDKPNARALVALFCQAALADGVPLQLSDAFNLDTAAGPQLDILGKYIGAIRSVLSTIGTDYFGFVLDAGGGNTDGFQDDNLNGSAIWNPDGLFLTDNYLIANRTDLPDSSFAILLRLKIVLNANDGTLASIQDLLKLFFPSLITVVDNRDMTLTYTVSRLVPVPADVIASYLPKPMGCGITVNIV